MANKEPVTNKEQIGGVLVLLSQVLGQLGNLSTAGEVTGNPGLLGTATAFLFSPPILPIFILVGVGLIIHGERRRNEAALQTRFDAAVAEEELRRALLEVHRRLDLAATELSALREHLRAFANPQCAEEKARYLESLSLPEPLPKVPYVDPGGEGYSAMRVDRAYSEVERQFSSWAETFGRLTIGQPELERELAAAAASVDRTRPMMSDDELFWPGEGYMIRWMVINAKIDRLRGVVRNYILRLRAQIADSPRMMERALAQLEGRDEWS